MLLVVSREAEYSVRLPVLRAAWMTQTFVHWPFSPPVVQALLSKPLVVDKFAGAAWVGFTPFVMTHVRPSAWPGEFTFAETNLRTYVRDPSGRDGLWFLSLEVVGPLMLAARAIGAPYKQGSLHVSSRREAISYAGQRRLGGASHHAVVPPGAATQRPSAQDIWLTSRWRPYTQSVGVVWETPVEHEPWPLSRARVEVLEQTLTADVGLPAPGAEPVVHFSTGVTRVRLGMVPAVAMLTRRRTRPSRRPSSVPGVAGGRDLPKAFGLPC